MDEILLGTTVQQPNNRFQPWFQSGANGFWPSTVWFPLVPSKPEGIASICICPLERIKETIVIDFLCNQQGNITHILTQMEEYGVYNNLCVKWGTPNLVVVLLFPFNINANRVASIKETHTHVEGLRGEYNVHDRYETKAHEHTASMCCALPFPWA